MDREISGTNRELLLAKAKRIDDKSWVEGFYFYMVHDDNRHAHHFIIPLGADLSLGTPIENIQVEVDPETVCTYIGVNDMNGKEIFTGYILRREIWGKIIVGEVVWNNMGSAGVFLKVADEERILYYPIGCGQYDDDEGKNCNDLILGNVFDNPELIKRNKG